jgi:hypothetical protein
MGFFAGTCESFTPVSASARTVANGKPQQTDCDASPGASWSACHSAGKNRSPREYGDCTPGSCAEPDGCFSLQTDPLHLVLRHPFLRPVMELPRARTHAPPSLARALPGQRRGLHWP